MANVSFPIGRASFLCLTLMSVLACSKPKTDDLVRLDTGVPIDVADEITPSMDGASTDGDADANLCEVGPGSRFELCNGQCVEIASDRANCGSCGRRCAPNETCNDGICEFACSPGLVNCDGRCIDPRTNPDYCGARDDCLGAANRGSQCTGGRACVNGRCQFVCSEGQVACDGTCIDPTSNRDFCGARDDCEGTNRGTVCQPGQVCTAMGCQCPSGFVLCDGTCIDPNTNRNFCGARGDCEGPDRGTACPMGQLCVGGTCGTTCGTGAVLCGGNCIDPLSNRDFCGARDDCTGANAGSRCSASELCINGTCTYFEPPPSYASLGIEQPVAASFDLIRPINVTIGAVRGGMIYYTCDGTLPAIGAMGTRSEMHLLTVSVGTSMCRTVRWFEDYGPPLGAERVIHSLTVNAPESPPTGTNMGNIVEGVRINDGPPVALLRPGQMFTLSYHHQWWSSNPGYYCSSCIVQSNVSMDYDNADGFISLECRSYGSGTNYPGRDAYPTHGLRAPLRPGRYAIRTTITLEYGCRPGGTAYPGGRAVGLIFVH
jgi:hypothetical protein